MTTSQNEMPAQERAMVSSLEMFQIPLILAIMKLLETAEALPLI